MTSYITKFSIRFFFLNHVWRWVLFLLPSRTVSQIFSDFYWMMFYAGQKTIHWKSTAEKMLQKNTRKFSRDDQQRREGEARWSEHTSETVNDKHRKKKHQQHWEGGWTIKTLFCENSAAALMEQKSWRTKLLRQLTIVWFWTIEFLLLFAGKWNSSGMSLKIT